MKQFAFFFLLCCSLCSLTSCNSFLEGLAMGMSNWGTYSYGNSYSSLYGSAGTSYAPTSLASTYTTSSSGDDYSISSYSSDDDCSTGSTITKRLCKKLHVGDHAHCGGSGVCSRCNGKGHYLDNSFGLSREVECPICYGSGKCAICNGTGYRY